MIPDLSVFISLLDEVIQDLEIRFTANDSGIIDELRKLIPNMAVALERSEVDNMVDISHLQYHSPSSRSEKYNRCSERFGFG